MIARKAAGASATVAALALAAGCAVTAPTTDPLPTDGSFVGVAAEDWQDVTMTSSSLRLAATMTALGAGQDVAVSPIGLQLLMSVLREGGTGATATQFGDVLGLPEGSGQRIADLRALLGEYGGDASAVSAAPPPATPVLHIAEGLFVTPAAEVRRDFATRASAYHGVEVVETSLAPAAAKPTLDAWLSESTGGLLAAVPAELPEGTQLALLDAVTFAGAWQYPFPTDGTADRPFTLADGTAITARTMAENLKTAYATGEGWQAVELPYTEGFVLRLTLTDTGRPPEWSAVADGLEAAAVTSVHVELPAWRTDTSVDVLPTLLGIGARAIARPGHLDRFFDGAVVGGVMQGVSITVDEAGTAAGAGAATDAEAPGEPTATIVFNRPFEYQLVHEPTGLVIIAGKLVDPR